MKTKILIHTTLVFLTGGVWGVGLLVWFMLRVGNRK